MELFYYITKPSHEMMKLCCVVWIISLCGCLDAKTIPPSVECRVDSIGNADSIRFDGDPMKNIGSVVAYVEKTYEIPFTNISDSTVSIKDVKASCSCLKSTHHLESKQIEPGEVGKLELSLTPKEGTSQWPVIIELNNGQQYRYVLTGRALILVDLSIRSVVLGTLDIGEGENRVVSVLANSDDWRLEKFSVIGSPMEIQFLPDSTDYNKNEDDSTNTLNRIGQLKVDFSATEVGRIFSICKMTFTNDDMETSLELTVTGQVKSSSP